MRAKKWFLPVVALAVLTACGVPIQSGANFASGWEPGRMATFAWRDARDRIVGDSRLEGNEVFHQSLHEAVGWELSLRGMRYIETDPDLLIHHHLSLADHVMETEVIDEAGVSSTESYVYEGGSLVVHIVDARTGDDAWVAWAEASVQPAFRGPDAMRRWVYDVVGRMFDDWPVPPRN
ncbi:MAG: DUF4136 domain-containing protein [Gemmatimonadota bacterium]|nr:DUF4136 domain-containing protein [Gemmatimonadota bacterium]MDH3421729.1 DUF4136 domain-containing protein [Gemmatimonadota bacterium]